MFWKAAVALMHDTRRLRSTFILAVCMIANILLYVLLVTAIVSVVDFKNFPNIITRYQVKDVNQIASVYPMQYNTLLIMVDDLHSKSPQLDGLWLVISQQETLKTFLIPVFPAIKDGSASVDLEYATTFDINSDGIPRRNFAALLESKGFWWETTLVIDRSGLQKMIEKLGENPPIRWAVVEDTKGGKYTLGSNDIVSALNAQIDMLDLFCRRSQSFIQMVRSDATPSMYIDHVKSNISSEQALAAQQRLMETGGGLSCEFPTFSGYIASNDG